jgi:hypothetical protein
MAMKRSTSFGAVRASSGSPAAAKPRSSSARAPRPTIRRTSSKGRGGRPSSLEDHVQRADQVGRGVDQGAVEVEGDGGAVQGLKVMH